MPSSSTGAGAADTPEHGAKDPDFDAVIVGAGFSGLYMLHRLRDVAGLSCRVFEAGDGVGGTWYWNRYPGARCDSESYYYSYSFSDDLQQEWVWSSKYPEQPEILRYLEHVADRFDLHRDIELGTRVRGATFDEASDTWTVRTEQGEEVTARFFVTGVGCLSAANVPDIPGLDRFEGDWYHTGAWPHGGVDFAGKRVGLIGTGSTGIQATPVIAEQAGHLYVFQRTPNYSVPCRNLPLSAEDTAEIKSNYSEIRHRARESFAGFPYAPSSKSATEVTPEERERTYQQLWEEEGGFKFIYGSYYDLLFNKQANDTASEFIRSKIREIVKDPEVAETLVPTNHPYGTKRPPIDTNYFETYNRGNVTLVDLRAAPIVEVTEKGICTEAGDYDLDIIVFATGFDAMTGSLLRMDIRGLGGRTLREKWTDGPLTYLGIQVAGFPNMFVITGPGSPSVLTNMPISIEHHVEWIGDCISHLRERGLTRIEASEEAEGAWVDHVRQVAEVTLFPLADSWYVGANIPGKQRVFMPYVGGFYPYSQRCEEVASKGYEGFVMSGTSG